MRHAERESKLTVKLGEEKFVLIAYLAVKYFLPNKKSILRISPQKTKNSASFPPIRGKCQRMALAVAGKGGFRRAHPARGTIGRMGVVRI
jgi:hypothetical protein